MGVDDRGEVGGGVRGDGGEIATLVLESALGLGGVGVGEGVEVIDESSQAQHVVVHVDEPFEGGCGDAVDDLLAVALQHRERGAQLVGEIGDDVASGGLVGLQPLGHVIERSGEFTQFTGCVVMARPSGRVTPADEAGGVGDPSQRADDASAERHRDQGGHHGGSERAEQDRSTEGVTDMALS